MVSSLRPWRTQLPLRYNSWRLCFWRLEKYRRIASFLSTRKARNMMGMETSTWLPRTIPPVGEIARIGLAPSYHIRRFFAHRPTCAWQRSRPPPANLIPRIARILSILIEHIVKPNFSESAIGTRADIKATLATVVLHTHAMASGRSRLH